MIEGEFRADDEKQEVIPDGFRRGGGCRQIEDGHGRDEEKYGGEPPEGDGLYRGGGGEIGTRRCEIQRQINRGKRKNAESAEMNAMNARELLDEKKNVSQEEMSNLEAQIEARLAQDIPEIYKEAGIAMEDVPMQHNPLEKISGMTAFITQPPQSGLTNASQAQRMGVPFDPNEQFDIHASYLATFQNWTPALVFVYVLTHPGSPCIFASKIPDIFGLPDESILPQERELSKDLLTREQIDELVEVRRRNNIKAAGTVQNVASEKDLYCALINNSVFVKIGARFELPRDIFNIFVWQANRAV